MARVVTRRCRSGGGGRLPNTPASALRIARLNGDHIELNCASATSMVAGAWTEAAAGTARITSIILVNQTPIWRPSTVMFCFLPCVTFVWAKRSRWITGRRFTQIGRDVIAKRHAVEERSIAPKNETPFCFLRLKRALACSRIRSIESASLNQEVCSQRI